MIVRSLLQHFINIIAEIVPIVLLIYMVPLALN